MGLPSDNTAAQPGIRASARHALTLAAFASVAGLALAPGLALADETAPAAAADAATNAAATADEAQASTSVSGLEVSAARQATPDSAKYVAPPVDTPQTITVVPKAVIEAQNLLTLRDILSTVPGITFGAGEGGGGYGDSINLRGYSAGSDITVDGVRDSAQYTRSDPFNLEQLEVTNGANGAQAGSGSVGGSINIVSKFPVAHDSSTVSVGAGTDSYARATIDANKMIGNGVAVRLNAMVHQNDAPGRDVENFRRWGVAPSVAFGLDTPTRASLSYFHQTDDNIPQYGVPFYNGRPVAGVNPSRYYGYSNIDTQKTDVDSFTMKLDHDFGANWSVRNLTRYQVVTAKSIVDPPQGTYCLANGAKPAAISATNSTGYTPCVAGDPAPGFYAPSGPRGNLRDSRNTTAYNQTDVTGRFNTGSVEHHMTAGVSLLSETYFLDTGRVFNNPGATPTVTYPQMNIANPNTIYSGPINYIRASEQDGQRSNEFIYIFDSAKITSRFEINGSIRFDHTEGVNSTDTYQSAAPSGAVTTPVGTITPGQDFRNSDDLLSYRIGAVFKPTASSSLYVAYGNSETPSQSAVNGGCTLATCNVDPEKARNIEIGGKWDAMDGKLSLTASVFRNERTNYKVPSGDPTLPDQVLAGSSRVDGIALGASGKVTDKWSIFANYTYLKSEVLSSVSPLVAAATGDPIKGDALTSVPDNAFSVFTTYDLPHRFQIGYGATYQGSYYLTQPTVGSTVPAIKSEPYWMSRLSVTWRASRNADLRLNVNNLFDEEYYNRGRNNGWATPGDTRNATLTLNYRF